MDIVEDFERVRRMLLDLLVAIIMVLAQRLIAKDGEMLVALRKTLHGMDLHLRQSMKESPLVAS